MEGGGVRAEMVTVRFAWQAKTMGRTSERCFHVEAGAVDEGEEEAEEEEEKVTEVRWPQQPEAENTLC